MAAAGRSGAACSALDLIVERRLLVLVAQRLDERVHRLRPVEARQ
jgi:hypothetical protein